MKTVKIHFLNTIWSDCQLIEVDGHYGFIDTASQFYYPMIKEYLTEHNISKIDFILLTHFHSDHYGNIVNLITDYPVDKVYFRKYSGYEGITSNGDISCDEYNEAETLKSNNIMEEIKKKSSLVIIDENVNQINLNGLDLYLYGTFDAVSKIYNDPTSEYYHVKKFSENYLSVTIFFMYNNHKVYLGSDMADSDTEIEGIYHNNQNSVRAIYNRFGINNIDIYKSSHHGGSGTNKIDLLKLLNSKYNIITNTSKWLDNWSTIPNMKEVNPDCEILTTDFNQYIFDLSTDKIKLKKIPKESLFITLNKN